MMSIYVLDSNDKAHLNEQNMRWLEQNFTDESVKNTFWKIPFVSELQ